MDDQMTHYGELPPYVDPSFEGPVTEALARWEWDEMNAGAMGEYPWRDR